MEAPTSCQHGMEEPAQLVRKTVRLPPLHADTAVQVPAENNDGMFGPTKGLAERTKIGVPVHKEREAVRLLDSPTILSWA
jgi:hypothetical protein